MNTFRSQNLLAALMGVLLIASAPAVRAESPAATAAPAAAPRLFGAMVADAVHAKATVERINYVTREAVLKLDTGELKSIVVGPRVQRLMEIHPGDTIELVYAESVVVFAGDSAGAPGIAQDVQVARAGADEKPGAAAVKTTDVVATVVALDFTERTVTLKGPQHTITLNVPAEAVNFGKMKVGDTVCVEYTQAIAAAVTKSAAAPAH